MIDAFAFQKTSKFIPFSSTREFLDSMTKHHHRSCLCKEADWVGYAIRPISKVQGHVFFSFLSLCYFIGFSTFYYYFAQIPFRTYTSNSCHSSASFLTIFCSLQWILLGKIPHKTLPQSKYQRYGYCIDDGVPIY